MADVDDPVARLDTYIASDSDWIDLDLTVSTDAGQTVVAPGEVQRRWEDGGRPHARFTASRVLDFYSVLSARYAVTTSRWGEVAIEILHHPDHRWNLERMAAGAQAALAFCSERFGPYPYRTLRIVEFPAYAAYAQAFPATIPFSEGIGFIARVDPADPRDIDYPFYVTAHEVAHQWWAHQLIGGAVQGSTMLSESFSQYTALMVMKQALGEPRMRRFLRYELDHYLGGRAGERESEQPLARAEGQQYLHYHKGSLAMYALQDRLGQDLVDRVLGEYIADRRWQDPPYTTTSEFLARLRAAAGEAHQGLIDDLFTRIVFHDNRTTDAWCRRRPDGAYDLTLTVTVRKVVSDGHGVESDVPPDADMDVGALDADGSLMHRERRSVPAGESTVTLVVPRRPAHAGIDPLSILIDREPDDNLAPVTER